MGTVLRGLRLLQKCELLPRTIFPILVLEANYVVAAVWREDGEGKNLQVNKLSYSR